MMLQCSLLLLAALAFADQCTNDFGDCRASRCCSSGGFACYRHRDFYFAQCREAAKEGVCGDEKPWLCPGWDTCVAAYEECSSSRCCNDPNYGCFLNFSHVGSWNALCQPRSWALGNRWAQFLELHRVTAGNELLEGLAALIRTNITSRRFFYSKVMTSSAFCEGTSELRCLSGWQHLAHEYLEILSNPRVDRTKLVPEPPDDTICNLTSSTAERSEQIGLCASMHAGQSILATVLTQPIARLVPVGLISLASLFVVATAFFSLICCRHDQTRHVMPHTVMPAKIRWRFYRRKREVKTPLRLGHTADQELS